MSSIYIDKTEKVKFDPVFDKVSYEVAFCLKIEALDSFTSTQMDFVLCNRFMLAATTITNRRSTDSSA